MKKYSDKIKEYEDNDYMDGIIEDIKNNDLYGATEKNITRNDKIDTLKMPYKKLTTSDIYSMARGMPVSLNPNEGQHVPSQFQINWNALNEDNKRSSKENLSEVPATPISEMPAVLKGKDLNPNYTQRMWESLLEGDIPGGMYNEMMHNEKNGYLGLGYANSHIFNYDDPYRGDLDRQREAIENRDPFSYDYREDDLYKSILAQKEKEADQAYKDGYAQLSRQFDGDIPVNMINKLIATKGEIIDQADSYIPQLRQLAYGMYQDEGNKMMQDYNLTQQAAAEDYDRWRSDRDFIISGIENKYARDLEKRNYERGVLESDRAFDLEIQQFNEYIREFDIEAALRQNQFDYEKTFNQIMFDYQKERDAIDDAFRTKEFEEFVRQYDIEAELRRNQFDYEKTWNQIMLDYQKERDKVADNQWESQMAKMYP